MPDILDYRWAIVIDLDEFFVFDPERFGSIRDFLAWHEIRPVDAIAVNWMGAACYGEPVWRDSPVTRRFPVPKGSINFHIKSVFRPGMFIHSSPHFPRTDERRRPIFLSSLGTHYSYGKSAQMAGLQPYEWPAISDEPDVSLASINHYFFKSAEEFLWKASRNRGDLPKETGISQEQRLLPFFKAFLEKYGEQPAEVDDRVVRCAPALEEEMARLRAIPGVAEAEAGVRTAFQARMGEILAFYRDPPPLLADDATARIVALATRSEPVIASRDADCGSAEVRATQSDGYSGLVIDLGVSEGNDTAYYLAKGFRVIGVEADAEACQRLRLRFKAEIESGAVKFLNFAASDTFGEPIDFFVHKDHQGVSATFKHPHLEAGYSQQRVMTIDWKTILAQAGVPRYLKIDIEMAEEAFLRGMMGYATPEFISVECHSLEPVELLHALGYERFKLVDQNPPGGFKLPAAQLEGRHIEWTAFNHASGPFGLDLFLDREWLDFAAFQEAWTVSREDYKLGRRPYRTWFDCHAWKPN